MNLFQRRAASFFILLVFSTPVLAIMMALGSAYPLRAAEARPAITIIAFGDSLTAGYLLNASEAFPAQLQMALQGRGHKVQVINAGVSGDTTAAGLERLSWALETKADAVIVELGGNDALRGIDPKETRANLDKIIAAIKADGTDVLIAGMIAPGNWGGTYAKEFNAIFPDLAKKYDAALYPFFLEGVALQSSLMMSDGLHPTAQGVAEVVKRILPEVEKLVERVSARKLSAGTQ